MRTVRLKLFGAMEDIIRNKLDINEIAGDEKFCAQSRALGY